MGADEDEGPKKDFARARPLAGECGRAKRAPVSSSRSLSSAETALLLLLTPFLVAMERRCAMRER
jgi:hypothetical protein